MFLQPRLPGTFSSFLAWLTSHGERSAMCPLGVAISYLSSRLNLVIARNVAILPVQDWPNRKERLLRRLALACHREERGDLDCQELAKQKERLLRRLASMCHREERGDLACSGLAKQKERLLRRLAMTILLSSRGTWRSCLFRIGQTEKRDCFAGSQ